MNLPQQPIVSILVPCFNSTATLSATLESICKSQYPYLDVMIVDDGSKETVEHIVKDFSDERFRYFWKENQGLGLTRNFGIDNFELILQGYSCRQIAGIFNEKGYITRSGRKEELGIISYEKSLKTGTEVKKRMWQGMTITQMTGMELYTGDYVYNKLKETHIGGRKVERLPKEEWKKSRKHA